MKTHPLNNLSYSGLQTLHSCPRKFYLDKCSAQTNDFIDFDQSVTFAFGHAVGLGLQEYLLHASLPKALFSLFLNWEPDLLAEDVKRKKSFWEACFAVEKFAYLRNELFEDYELAYYNGKPAIELSFRIALPNGYFYRGFVDAVLVHRTTGKVIVLENKTTAAKVTDAAMYKNSFQGIGYSIVLDQIFPELSSYQIYYLVYNTNNYEYLPLPFTKSLAERAEWLTTLWMQTQTLEMYRSTKVFPKQGASCYQYFRQCPHYTNCSFPLLAPIEEVEDNTVYDIETTFENLIQAQQQKAY